MRASADSLEAALIARESGATFESHLRGVVLAEVERLRYHAAPPVATDGWHCPNCGMTSKDAKELREWKDGIVPVPPADAPQEKV